MNIDIKCNSDNIQSYMYVWSTSVQPRMQLPVSTRFNTAEIVHRRTEQYLGQENKSILSKSLKQVKGYIKLNNKQA